MYKYFSTNILKIHYKENQNCSTPAVENYQLEIFENDCSPE
jgi:hypothetical protein